MTTPDPRDLVDRCAANVHAWWMRRKRKPLNGSATSRNEAAAELMVPFADLDPQDQDDDRASVDAVIEQLRREDPAVVAQLIWPDRVLEGRLRDMFAVCDPPPAGLAPRLVAAASAEAAARAGLAAAAVTRDSRRRGEVRP